jgi:hypothetical protein
MHTTPDTKTSTAPADAGLVTVQDAGQDQSKRQLEHKASQPIPKRKPSKAAPTSRHKIVRADRVAGRTIYRKDAAGITHRARQTVAALVKAPNKQNLPKAAKLRKPTKHQKRTHAKATKGKPKSRKVAVTVALRVRNVRIKTAPPRWPACTNSKHKDRKFRRTAKGNVGLQPGTGRRVAVDAFARPISYPKAIAAIARKIKIPRAKDVDKRRRAGVLVNWLLEVGRIRVC